MVNEFIQYLKGHRMTTINCYSKFSNNEICILNMFYIYIFYTLLWGQITTYSIAVWITRVIEYEITNLNVCAKLVCNSFLDFASLLQFKTLLKFSWLFTRLWTARHKLSYISELL